MDGEAGLDIHPLTLMNHEDWDVNYEHSDDIFELDIWT